jgi:hypothetical protein
MESLTPFAEGFAYGFTATYVAYFIIILIKRILP